MRQFSRVEWSYSTNIYEVNTRQYTTEGNFQAFELHIDRLAAMGVELLWFMPITPISEKGRLGSLGSYYACSDYQSINPEFGTLADFKKLVNTAHAAGLKVIIDWVANHTGQDHIWTEQFPHFYQRNEQGEFFDKNGWTDVIDLNYYDHALRRKMVSAMRFWVEECGIDGFRCDMAHLVPLDFWRDARRELEQFKQLFWLAETSDPVYSEVFDCIYAWNWMHKSEAFVRGQIDLSTLRNFLQDELKELPAETSRMYFTTNHDENSWNGTEYEKYGDLAAALAVFSATWPGIPLVYSGQEIPNQRRLKFFDKDELDWDKGCAKADFYQKLNGLRKRNPACRANYLQSPVKFLCENHPQVLAFERVSNGAAVIVVLNLSSFQAVLEISPSRPGRYRELFSGEEFEFSKTQRLSLGPGEYFIMDNG